MTDLEEIPRPPEGCCQMCGDDLTPMNTAKGKPGMCEECAFLLHDHTPRMPQPLRHLGGHWT